MALAIGSVSILVHEVTGYSGDVLTVPSLPTDGSLGLAFLEVDGAVGEWIGGFDRHLIAFVGGNHTSNEVQFDPAGAPSSFYAAPPSGWAFVV